MHAFNVNCQSCLITHVCNLPLTRRGTGTTLGVFRSGTSRLGIPPSLSLPAIRIISMTLYYACLPMGERGEETGWSNKLSIKLIHH